jgi:ribonuclease R
VTTPDDPPGSADRDRVPPPLRAILEGEGLDPRFSDEVMAEAAALVAAPGLDDPALEDEEAVPYVTVDGAGTRDLDQALHLERDGVGYRVRYAIADAAHYVRPGTALFAEALRRGTSFYLPGLSVPMLPRALSEGAVSLNAGAPRRALVFDMRVDDGGACLGTTLRRARIKSRAKLSFEQVQGLLDDPASSPLAGEEYAASLALLPVVGRLRQLEAAARQVIRYHREEIQVGMDGDAFTVLARLRHAVERHNEQLSLLCNAEGGRLLCEAVGDDTSQAAQAIYRIHPAPPAERLEELEQQLAELVALHDLDAAQWGWERAQPLAEWVEALPSLGTDERLARIARAVERQAVMVNVRSVFSAEPGQHFGVGAQPYARFSAPMREIVGVFVHKEAVEMMGLAPRHAAAEDAELRDQVLAAANAARERQRRLIDLTNRRILDQIFGADVAVPRRRRTVRVGTIMGVSASKIYVTLDEPPIDVKLYVADAGRALGGTWLSLSPGHAALLDEGGAARFTVGDTVRLRLVRRDEARDRWVFEPVTEPVGDTGGDTGGEPGGEPGVRPPAPPPERTG